MRALSFHASLLAVTGHFFELRGVLDEMMAMMPYEWTGRRGMA